MVIVGTFRVIDDGTFAAWPEALFQEPEFARLCRVVQELASPRCDPGLELLIAARLVPLGGRVEHPDVAKRLGRPFAGVVVTDQLGHAVALQNARDLLACRAQLEGLGP